MGAPRSKTRSAACAGGWGRSRCRTRARSRSGRCGCAASAGSRSSTPGASPEVGRRPASLHAPGPPGPPRRPLHLRRLPGGGRARLPRARDRRGDPEPRLPAADQVRGRRAAERRGSHPPGSRDRHHLPAPPQHLLHASQHALGGRPARRRRLDRDLRRGLRGRIRAPGEPQRVARLPAHAREVAAPVHHSLRLHGRWPRGSREGLPPVVPGEGPVRLPRPEGAGQPAPAQPPGRPCVLDRPGSSPAGRANRRGAAGARGEEDGRPVARRPLPLRRGESARRGDEEGRPDARPPEDRGLDRRGLRLVAPRTSGRRRPRSDPWTSCGSSSRATGTCWPVSTTTTRTCTSTRPASRTASTGSRAAS